VILTAQFFYIPATQLITKIKALSSHFSHQTASFKNSLPGIQTFSPYMKWCSSCLNSFLIQAKCYKLMHHLVRSHHGRVNI